jgi:hypothetical protein
MSTVDGTAGGVSHDKNHPMVLGFKKELELRAFMSPNLQEETPKPDIFLLYRTTEVPPNSLPTKVLKASNMGGVVYLKVSEKSDSSDFMEYTETEIETSPTFEAGELQYILRDEPTVTAVSTTPFSK